MPGRRRALITIPAASLLLAVGLPVHADPLAGEEPPWGLQVSALFSPLGALTVDEDPDEDPVLSFDGEFDFGPGWGAGVGFAFDSCCNLGLSYLRTDHVNEEEQVRAALHSVFLEAQARGVLTESDIQPLLFVALGVGGTVWDFDRTIDDTGGAMIGGRVGLGFRVFGHVDLLAGGAYYQMGWPGETVGGESFLWTELAIRF